MITILRTSANKILRTSVNSVLIMQYLDLPMSATDLTDQGYSSETIDERLIYLATLGLVDISIYLFGNEPRTSASDAAVLILTDAGCFIMYDG